MTILPLTYAGNTEWYSKLLSDDCIIDINENYIKQSCRNRCEIYSANGVMTLTVNVVKGGSCRKRPLKDMRIDYSKRWQHQHWISIVSAYKNSPYFDYYAERFASFYEKHYEFLIDLNRDILYLMLELLGTDVVPRFSEDYIEAGASDNDMRNHKFLAADAMCGTCLPEYFQVFEDKQPFVAGLSILDLFFCEGSGAKALLRKG